ncbi:hypothetical protein Q2T76_03930 [Lactobacillus sp. YT155]|uniref:hypothetical protein n=1 Tax=Lactobacillus sp. YT155 TaxID=3060955 RepID=UPI00265F0C3A|nr:hypothetical protein [Lactobacillus sp. YT155]MDO1605204.1 hypothetical protein [Lactobacillus sp. YT155]
MSFKDKKSDELNLYDLDDIIAEDNRLKFEAYGDVLPKESQKEIDLMSKRIAAYKKAYKSGHSMTTKELKKIK